MRFNAETLDLLVIHNIYKNNEEKPKPLRWTDLETFAKWVDARLESRREHLATVLTPHQYWVTQRKGTERAFTGEYWWYNDVGMYNCVVCTQRLFTFEHKYKSKSGYPTFWNALKDSVRFDTDHLYVPAVTNALQDPTLQCKTPIKRMSCSNVSQMPLVNLKMHSASRILDTFSRTDLSPLDCGIRPTRYR